MFIYSEVGLKAPQACVNYRFDAGRVMDQTYSDLAVLSSFLFDFEARATQAFIRLRHSFRGCYIGFVIWILRV